MIKLFDLIKVAALAVSFALTGCQTMSDVISAREKGESVSEVYKISEETAWDIAKKVVRQEGFGVIEEVRKERYFLTTSDVSAFEYGTLLGVWIEPVGKEETRVSVVSKRKVATTMVTNLSEEGFHEEFLKELRFQVKQGRLPASVLKE